MSSIFISYSRKDKAFAERLLADLSKRSRDAWIDWEDIPPASRWLEEIRGAIEAADAFLLLISPDSVASAVCAQEVTHAVAVRKRVIPLLIRETPLPQVMPEVASLNWIFFRGEDDFDAAMAKLLETLDTDLEWVRAHTRLLTRAVEWDRHGRDESYLLRGADLDMAQSWIGGAAEGKRPEPAALHYEYLRASQAVQAQEIERLQTLYRNTLARQLAAQAAQLQAEAHALLDRSMLLAVESQRRLPNAEADRVLRAGLQLRAQEIARWRHDGAPALLVASSDGRYLIGCTTDKELTIRTCADLSPYRVVPIAGVQALAFVPGLAALCAARADGWLVLIDLERGTVIREVGRHPGRVHALIAVPGDEALVSLGEGGACCWGLRDGATRWQLSLEGESWAGAANGRGDLLAIGAGDCVLRLVDAASGEVRHECAHDAERPVFLLERGASDAGIVATGFLDAVGIACSAALDGSVRWWDMATGEELHRGVHRRDLLCMAIHGGRSLVATGSLDSTLRVWDAAGRELARLEHQAGVTGVAWSDDGRWLASACGDGTARLWKVAERESGLTESDLEEAARCVHADWVEALVLPANGAPVSASSDGEVIAWTIGEPDFRGQKHDYALKNAACSDDGAHVIVTIDGPRQILYEVNERFRWRFVDHPDFIQDAWITRDGALVTTCWDGGVREFDLQTLAVKHVQQHANRVWNAALSSDQRWLATAVEREPYVRLWRRGDVQATAELQHSHQVRSIAFSPDGTLLATACDDGTVRVWDLGPVTAQGSTAHALWTGEHKGTAWWIAFHPSGEQVASGGEDGDVVLRDARTGEVYARWPQRAAVSSLAFSPSGRWLAVSHSFEGPFEVKLWDLHRGELAGGLRHEEHVHEMDWSPDGTMLATASQDKRVRVFDAAARRELVRLQFEGMCGSARFVPQSSELLSTSYDGWLRLSVIAPDVLIERALARVPRRLTEGEWRQYLPDEPWLGSK